MEEIRETLSPPAVPSSDSARSLSIGSSSSLSNEDGSFSSSSALLILNSRGATLLSLSAEVLEHILQYLDVRSLAQCAQTCKTLQQLRWPVVDLRRFSLGELGEDTFRYLVLKRKPHTLLLKGYLGCPRSSLPLQRVRSISGSPLLQVLSLEAAYLGDEGVKPLAALLPYLRALNLSHNNLSDVGIQLLAKSLGRHTAVRRLDLRANKICDAGVVALAQALPSSQLASLSLEKNHFGTNGSTALGQSLAAGAQLRELNLAETYIGDAGIAGLVSGLADNSNLFELVLARCRIGDNGATLLGRALPRTRLHRLDLGENDITASGLAAICDGLAGCTTIHSADLHGNPLDQQASFALESLLTRTQTLSALVLDACRLGPDGMTGLAHGLASNTSLRTLSAINNGGGLAAAAALAQALLHNSSLQVLSLSYNHFGDTGLELLCESLASNQGVAVLKVADNNAGERALLALAAALVANHSLVSLDVSGNAAVSLAACAALGSGLARNSRLERFVCRVALMGAPQMSALVDGMLKCETRRNRSLRGLNLAGNDLGAEGSEAMARLLCNDRVDLECIDLSGNDIGDAGMLHLSKGLEFNTRLLRLRLCNNSIGPAGAARLGQALACCQTTSMLEMLDLSGNMLSDEGVTRLCEGLRSNRHLKKLSLANNAVGPQGTGALVGLLAASLNLQHLSLEENPLDVAGVVSLTSGLRANRGLHHLNMRHVSGDNTNMEELQLAFSRLGRSNQAVFVERSKTCG